MDASDRREAEETATAYDELLVPALFGPWAPRMLEAARIGPGDDVLDVACGTGVLARAAAERVGPAATVCGIDANPGMLAVARRRAPHLDWREADAAALPFDDASFDVVASQFGLMFLPDAGAALREMARVLRPGGRIALCVFDSLDHVPAYAAVADVFEARLGRTVADALRLPFSMGDAEALPPLATDAGLAEVSVATRTGTARFADARAMILADVKGWFPFAGFRVDDATLDALASDAAGALAAHATDDGALAFAVPVHLLTATRP